MQGFVKEFCDIRVPCHGGRNGRELPLHLARCPNLQVMIPDVQKLINQSGNVSIDIFNTRLIKPPTSVLVFPLKVRWGRAKGRGDALFPPSETSPRNFCTQMHLSAHSSRPLV